ncbi:MAG: hypothetical protein H6566_24475 [Lewinellaceae bacterium]|nr:hypothetical protein [Lewinellaceae bacterium]
MNTDSFTQYLRNPSLLYQISYQELKSLALQYPYCQNLHWLLLQKSYMDALPDWEQNLHRAAAYSIDRNFLYQQMKQMNAKVPETDNFLLEEEYLELKSLSELEEDGHALLKMDRNTAEHSPIEQGLSQPLGGEEPYHSPEGGLEFSLHDEDENMEDEEMIEETEAEAGLAPPEGEKESRLTDLEETVEEEEEEEAAESSTDNQSISQAVQVDQPTLAFQADESLLPALAAIDAILSGIQEPSPAAIPSAKVEAVKPPRPLISPELTVLKNQPYTRLAHPKPLPELPPQPARPQPKQSFTSWIEQFQSPHIQGQLGELMESRKREEKKKKKKLKKKKGVDPANAVSRIATRSITENEEIASETLAELLASQGLSDKACEMYQRLMLVFPEKSDYFASKIANLKSE